MEDNIMKKTYKFLAIAALALTVPIVTGCFDLSEKWYSEVTPDTFFTTKESVSEVLNRPFTHAFWYEKTDRWYLQEYTADQLCQPQRGSDWYDGGSWARYHHHEWTDEESSIWQTWRGTGMGISLTMECQKDLEGVDYPSLGLTDDEKKDNVNQLNCLIAYFYERGLDYFGAFPIEIDPLDSVLPRSTPKHVYEHVESMLKDAIENCYPATEDNSRIIGMSKGTAAALLARLYFNANWYIGEDHFSDCAAICKDFLDGKYGYYKLGATWNECFGFDNKNSKDLIWAHPSQMNYLEFSWLYTYTQHYNMYQYFGVDNISAYNGNGLDPSTAPDGTAYTTNLGRTYSKFNDKDLRKKEYVYKGGTSYEGMFIVGPQYVNGVAIKGGREYSGKQLNFVDYCAKMSTLAKGGNPSSLSSTIADGEENSLIRWVKCPIASDINYRWSAYEPVIRLEEIYYMLAECEMRSGDKAGAAKLINTVRRRAFANYDDPDPVTASNLDKWRMVDEWGIEFLGEGRRRTDLCRWDLYTTQSWWDHQPSDESRTFYPVPVRAISGNNHLTDDPI